MEKWKFLFMMGSGIYLLLLGVLMIKRKDISMSKGIGVYNVTVGTLSIIFGIAAKLLGNIGNKIFFVFTIVLIVSFIIFNILRMVSNKN